MLLKYFYDTALAHASYMVGCQRANVAVIVDPGRDIEPYLNAALAEGLQIVAVAETHIHADYVSVLVSWPTVWAQSSMFLTKAPWNGSTSTWTLTAISD